ncbi:MAG: L,D-transpeptidase family protein [Gammaproteobacteria bacterium]|nr:L,D-transpeptidase family protein [Gammaproteobacteria bacterium]
MAQHINVISNAQQMLWVTPRNFDDFHADLQFYEKDTKGRWQKHGETIPVIVGKNGVAWDENQADFYHRSSVNYKKEGDFKTPLGIYHIEKIFGFAKHSFNPNMPYLSLTTHTEGVDDITSKYYNQIVDARFIQNKDWKSSEKMREISLYQWGAVIDYNVLHIRGNGSNIFIHIWKDKKSPTAGCIAMSELNLEKILSRLDQAKHPVIVILPSKVFKIRR